jgi:hypothetical protein
MVDREFIGEKWIQHLAEHKIPFYIRIRKNTLLPADEMLVHAADLFDDLTQNTCRVIQKTLYGDTFWFAGTRSCEADLVIIMTNQPQQAKEILTIYRRRWSIEILFNKLKSSGFNWENTQMKGSKRLVKLLVILSIASLCSYLMGLNTKIPWKKTLGCFAKTVFRQGLQNFQHYVSTSIYSAISILLSLLNNLSFLILHKTDG